MCNQPGCLGQNDFTKITHTCKVCEIIDGDTGIKGVAYCSECGAYICETCWDNWARRGAAAVVEFFNSAKRKLMNKK